MCAPASCKLLGEMFANDDQSEDEADDTEKRRIMRLLAATPMDRWNPEQVGPQFSPGPHLV